MGIAAVKVEAGTYAGYATWMADKIDSGSPPDNKPMSMEEQSRNAGSGIFLGKGVPVVNRTRHSDDIFIARGRTRGWSDGCIVADSNW